MDSDPNITDRFRPLIESDLAKEVHSTFSTTLGDGADLSAATGEVIRSFGSLLTDPHDGPVVLVTVAVAMLNEGKVLPAIRDAVIDLIDTGEAQRAWPSSDGKLAGERRALLRELADALRTADIAEDDTP
jgi:hypothetical protein